MRKFLFNHVFILVSFLVFCGVARAYEVGIKVLSLQEVAPDLEVTVEVTQKGLTGTQLIYEPREI